MSRTYRRTNKGQKRAWLPNIWKLRCDASIWSLRSRRETCEKWLEENTHREKDVGDYFYCGTPMAWWHDRHNIPCRRKETALLRKVLKDEVDSENIVWPTNKKPVIYWD